MFSSSKLLNSVEEKSDNLQKYLIDLKSNKISQKIIETIEIEEKIK